MARIFECLTSNMLDDGAVGRGRRILKEIKRRPASSLHPNKIDVDSMDFQLVLENKTVIENMYRKA